MTEHWQRVGELFDRALAAAPGERAAIIETASVDEAIKAEVRSLVAAHERASGFLEQAAVTSDATPAPQSAATRSSSALPAGATIGPYRVTRLLGRGGMGVVYEAEDTRLSRRVALKSLPLEWAGEERQRQRLRREARAAAALQHPGIATIYALEELEGQILISSELLDGETLRAEIERGPLPLADALASAVEIARALAAAHERGIVHRDLKPENIVRTRSGVLKILDFGLAQFDDAARDLASITRLTQDGLIVGTPAYMAPEQLLGRPTDCRADHFALGVLLYELCTGAHPFGGETLPSTIARILAAQPNSPSPAELPLPVWNIIERCLRKDPNERFPSTSELLARLAEVQKQLEEQGTHAAQAHSGSQQDREPPRVTDTQAALAAASAAEPRPAALAWWRFHQFAAAMVYWAMVWPAWVVHRSLGRAGLFFFFATLAAVVVASTLRLHLWFSSRVYPENLPEQRLGAARWLRSGDVAFAALLIVGGLALPEDRSAWAALLISVGTGAAVAFTFIEPATARAAFSQRAR